MAPPTSTTRVSTAANTTLYFRIMAPPPGCGASILRLVMSEPVTVEKFAIGQSVRRLEDPRLVQGLGRYSDDVDVPRQAHAVVIRSTHAHARLRGLATAAALKAPGV